MYSCPHFEFSGFIRRGERYVYFATGDLRWKICNSILLRTAKSDTDYTGGQNYSVMYNMSNSMFATMVKLRVDYLFSIEVNK